MNKTKWYIVGGIFPCLIMFCLVVFLVKPAKAETSTTFPADEAGIAAYVKINNIENIDIDALAEALHVVERQAESYVIGTVKVTNEVNPNYPHLYVGLDGWMVAYYLKDQEASRIMQWKGYTKGSINTTTLQDAIDIICTNIGVTYSSDIKYYDFEFPEANKMTLVAEKGFNDFYVTVPGTLYEASYEVILMGRCGGGSAFQYVRLKVDETLIYEAAGGGGWCFWRWFTSYDYYDLSIFTAGVTHHVVFNAPCGDSFAYATVLIYKN